MVTDVTYRTLTDAETEAVKESPGTALMGTLAHECPVECLKCDAPAGSPCESPSGEATYLHGARAKAWAKWSPSDSLTPAAPAPRGDTFESLKAYGVLGEAVAQELERVAAQAREAAEAAAKATACESRRLEVVTPKAQKVEVDHAHAALEELLAWVQDGHGTKAAATNPLLVGPTGSGKGMLARQAAKAFDLELVIVPFSPDDMVYDFLGFKDANGGKVKVPLTDAWERPCLILFDELDRARTSTLTRLNEAVASGRLETPNGTLHLHPDSIIIGAGNTLGHGATEAYTAAQALDVSNLSRWCPVVQVDYDPDLEAGLARSLAGDVGAQWAGLVQEVREACESLGVNRHPADTRTVLAGARSLARRPEARAQVLEACLMARLTDNTRDRVRANVQDALKAWVVA